MKKTLDYTNEIEADISDSEHDKEFSNIIDEIKNNKSIEKLTLRGNGLAEKHITQLTEALTEHKI